jgi:hypothetical protein
MNRKATHIATKGAGYDYYPANFGRLTEDTPVSIAIDEHARPHCVIVYRLSDDRRMHIRRDALTEVNL